MPIIYTPTITQRAIFYPAAALRSRTFSSFSFFFFSVGQPARGAVEMEIYSFLPFFMLKCDSMLGS